MKQNTKFLIVAVILLAIIVPVVFAEDIISALSHPTINVVYDGATPIKDAIDTKVQDAEVAKGELLVSDPLADTKSLDVDKPKELGLAVETIMTNETYPYIIPTEVSKEEPIEGETKVPVTEITIIKARYDEETTTMWYWISATRDGQEVAVNNPVWIYPAPKDIIVSEVLDEKTNVMTITRKEDPKAATEKILREYVDQQPIGKAIVGTKE